MVLVVLCCESINLPVIDILGIPRLILSVLLLLLRLAEVNSRLG